MKTLEEAWEWYDSTRKSLLLYHRLGERYWIELPWGGPLGGDDKFKSVEPDTVIENSRIAREPLDDLAVLVFFSVFEGVVREVVLSEIRDAREATGQPRIKAILVEAVDSVENGSIARILSHFKGAGSDLVEEVNQVRRYRNWVAHGKRSVQPAFVTPRTAFDRRSKFLSEMRAGAIGQP